ncbi:MAG: hypothetical protein MUO78_01150 [candidate division Zixibacteria bacterium]|nr:hypothetical protein [candidate division Zixibacteria bacterium]
MEKEFASMITKILETNLESERWDPDYWSPKWFKNIKIFSQLRCPVKKLGEFITFLTYGKIKTGEKRAFKKEGVRYIDSANLGPIGFDFFKKMTYIAKDDDRNAPDKKPILEDILLTRDGVGCIGRSVLFLEKDSQNYIISDHVDIIRLKEINPYYVYVYLQTKYGKDQIERTYHGVGSPGIHFHHIKSLLIPILPQYFQKKIENQYKRIYSLDIESLKIKETLIKKGLYNDEAEKNELYMDRLERANKELSNLVHQVEDYIVRAKE